MTVLPVKQFPLSTEPRFIECTGKTLPIHYKAVINRIETVEKKYYIWDVCDLNTSQIVLSSEASQEFNGELEAENDLIRKFNDWLLEMSIPKLCKAISLLQQASAILPKGNLLREIKEFLDA